MNEQQISNLDLFKIFENKEGVWGSISFPVASFISYAFDTGHMIFLILAIWFVKNIQNIEQFCCSIGFWKKAYYVLLLGTSRGSFQNDLGIHILESFHLAWKHWHL